jgi:hypothetical protein
LFLKSFTRQVSWYKDVTFTDIGGFGEKSSNRYFSHLRETAIADAPPKGTSISFYYRHRHRQ